MSYKKYITIAALLITTCCCPTYAADLKKPLLMKPEENSFHIALPKQEIIKGQIGFARLAAFVGNKMGDMDNNPSPDLAFLRDILIRENNFGNFPILKNMKKFRSYITKESNKKYTVSFSEKFQQEENTYVPLLPILKILSNNKKNCLTYEKAIELGFTNKSLILLGEVVEKFDEIHVLKRSSNNSKASGGMSKTAQSGLEGGVAIENGLVLYIPSILVAFKKFLASLE